MVPAPPFHPLARLAAALVLCALVASALLVGRDAGHLLTGRPFGWSALTVATGVLLMVRLSWVILEGLPRGFTATVALVAVTSTTGFCSTRLMEALYYFLAFSGDVHADTTSFRVAGHEDGELLVAHRAGTGPVWRMPASAEALQRARRDVCVTVPVQRGRWGDLRLTGGVVGVEDMGPCR